MAMGQQKDRQGLASMVGSAGSPRSPGHVNDRLCSRG